MRSYWHLSEDERDQIGVLRAAGRSMGAIARALGRAKATISRELQRNALPSGGYSPLHAAGAYQLRRQREAILEREAALRLFVGDRLAEGWTPEQISGWLKSGNEPRLRAIGCETIYAFIYRTGQKAEALWRYLTRRHKRRRPRRARASRDTIKDRRSIMIVRRSLKAAERPAIGRATSSSANAHGLCSSCMSVSHGSRSPRGSQGKPPQKPSQRCSRCSAASILICEDKSLSTTTPLSPSTACSGPCAT
jgi:IS30 family transposase